VDSMGRLAPARSSQVTTMALHLLQLIARFEGIDDVETAHAFFRTKLPTVAPEAYLHTVYKPAPAVLMSEVSAELKLPGSVVDFYHCCNGAHLFVNALSIFGCVASETTINRSDRFKLLPFDVREINRELKAKFARGNLVAIAFYSYDGSLVCVERATGETICFVGDALSKERTRWKSIDEWLSQEIQRISFLFDQRGNRLVEKENLLPGIEPSRVN